ncbi:MAG: divalent-cation tolerance protein CutA [Alphaproteobacteria bacterium]
MADLRFVYVTAGSREEALAIARAAVGERLAACANILGDITSVYRWEGAVQEDTETSLILKTTAANLPALTERIREVHSYTVPCVVTWALDPEAGNPEFLEWLEAESAPAG